MSYVLCDMYDGATLLGRGGVGDLEFSVISNTHS